MTKRSIPNDEQLTVAELQKRIIEGQLKNIENKVDYQAKRSDDQANRFEEGFKQMQSSMQNLEKTISEKMEKMGETLARKTEVALQFEKYKEELAPLKSLANKVNAALFSAVVSLLGIVGVMVVYVLNR